MTDDDWEPLPADQRGLHPGELAGVPRRIDPPEPTTFAPPVVFEAPHDLVAEAAAEKALLELRARLLKTKPGTSLIAEAQHRESRVERKRRAAKVAVDRALQQQAVAGSRENKPPVAPGIEIDTKVADIDPRETEPWFAVLPVKERERLRAHWWSERHRHDDAGVRTRRRIGRAIGYGAALFFVLSVLQTPWFGSFGSVLKLTTAGAVAAGLAEITGGGRVRYAIAGALAFASVMGGSLFQQPNLLFSLVIMTYAMATLGMDGEMRRTGGFTEE